METTKYGLAYVLSNNWVGMSFNDKTKIISNSSGEIAQYITSSKIGEQIIQFSLTNFPENMYKKVMLLQLLKKQLGFKDTPDIQNSEGLQVNYIKNWLKAPHALLFRLNNKVIQVWFHDRSELLFSSQNKNVTFINKVGEISSYPLSTALEQGNKEMVKRLKYSKDVLVKMLKGNEKN